MDVSMIQIGNLDCLWCEMIENPALWFKVLSYNAGSVEGHSLTNYFLASGQNNALFVRCHQLLLGLWAADDGKVSTKGMHCSL
jgi:hypothetical protein